MNNVAAASQGQSKEQALAANSGNVQCTSRVADAVFAGRGNTRPTVTTPRADLTSRRSLVRAQYRPLNRITGLTVRPDGANRARGSVHVVPGPGAVA
jgi:hypothetical protein